MLKALKIVIVVLFAAGVSGLVAMYLWNWLMPAVFGLSRLTFLQALGLLLLSKLFFGGFHRHSGGRNWRRQMEERWSRMTSEERDRFRSGMRRGRGWGCKPSMDGEPEQTSA